MPRITVNANSHSGIDLEVTTPAHSITVEFDPNRGLTLASRIMNQLGVTSLTNNPDGTWTAR